MSTAKLRAALWLVLIPAAGRPCLAQDDPQQELEKLRKEVQELRKGLDVAREQFEAYKATATNEIDRLKETVAVQTARARQAETGLRHVKARLELARSRSHDLQEAVARLEEEVRQAAAINAENRAWLEKMTKETREATEQVRALLPARQRLATEHLVRSYLPNAIENYRLGFKRLPPMSVKELNMIGRFKPLWIDANASNQCSEALVVALRNPDFAAPLRARFLPTSLGNTDSDQWNQVPGGGSSLDALEILDAWGHPVVYVHKNQYNVAVEVVNGKGAKVKVVALKKPDGTYYNPTSYQLISLGPNGVQETTAKDSDDIRNFALKSK
jgi:hypothetical protein